MLAIGNHSKMIFHGCSVEKERALQLIPSVEENEVVLRRGVGALAASACEALTASFAQTVTV
jgi:hypothetical protein